MLPQQEAITKALKNSINALYVLLLFKRKAVPFPAKPCEQQNFLPPRPYHRNAVTGVMARSHYELSSGQIHEICPVDIFLPIRS
jgi:hypothetical protein